MSNQLVLVAAKYENDDRAHVILDMLEQMNHAGTIKVDDLAIVVKDADGKLQTVETRELTAKKGAKRGAIAAGILGVIFPPSLIVSVVAGGAIGAAWGKLRDTGIKSDAMEHLGETLEPGKAAVVVLASQDSVTTLERALQGYDGELLQHVFSASESAEIEAAAAAS